MISHAVGVTVELRIIRQNREYLIQRLMLILGGPRLVFITHTEFGLPSYRSTQEHSTVPHIQACIGFPTREELAHNLKQLHISQSIWPHETSPPRRRGFSLLVDETALEERPRYDGTRNAVLGIAREDAVQVDLTPVTFDTLSAINDAMREGTVRRASEATVAILAAFGKEHYHGVPFMISGTAKRENEEDQSTWLELLIDEYTVSEFGACLYGDLWNTGTDGDPIRRKSLHKICMKRTLGKTDPLFSLLGALPRMNLRCGVNFITLDVDYRHKFKSGYFYGLAPTTPHESRSLLMLFLKLHRHCYSYTGSRWVLGCKRTCDCVGASRKAFFNVLDGSNPRPQPV